LRFYIFKQVNPNLSIMQYMVKENRLFG